MTHRPVTHDDDLLLVGRVARTHGLRGDVIVNPESDFVKDRFRVGQILLVGPADRAEAREIRDIKFHQGRPIVALAGVETMTDAEALAGAELWLPQAALGPLPEGTFYRHDLVGCEVRDTKDALVGRVTAGRAGDGRRGLARPQPSRGGRDRDDPARRAYLRRSRLAGPPRDRESAGGASRVVRTEGHAIG
jgi:16S rRNA processing protein RimM